MDSQGFGNLMREIEAEYEVEVVPLTIGDKTLKILKLKDFEAEIDKRVEAESVGISDLPLWAMLWEASFVLAHFIGRQPVAPGRRILEIGAGMGVVGLHAAMCGHEVVITDINEDALRFARANAALNGCDGVEVRCLDWADPGPLETYDMIIGSEVVYERETYPLLVRFLRRALSPGGVIFLGKNDNLKGTAFFELLTEHFRFKRMTQTLRASDRQESISLFAIRRKGE
ncbi:MAG: methyltransferase domain-containing protein [Desulfobacterales bacterium]|nr:methyltransferase domain-containing protein [Desulfobacterales bacterium]